MGVEAIKEILQREDLKSDVIRVLGIFGGSLWLSEVEDEIKAMNGSMGVQLQGDVKKAVEELEKEGIVTLDYRPKGDLSGKSVREYLVKLKDLSATLMALAGDEKYRRYINVRREAMWR